MNHRDLETMRQRLEARQVADEDHPAMLALAGVLMALALIAFAWV